MLIRKRMTTSPAVIVYADGKKNSSRLLISPRASIVRGDGSQTDSRLPFSPRAIVYGDGNDSEPNSRARSPPPSPRAKCAPLRLREVIGLVIATAAVSLCVWLIIQRDIPIQDFFFQLPTSTGNTSESPRQTSSNAASSKPNKHDAIMASEEGNIEINANDLLVGDTLSSQLASDADLVLTEPEQLIHAPKEEFMFLAFYYPWYVSDDWSRHGTQGSSPLLGHYGSDKIEIAERHIEMAVRGGLDAWAVSWWRRDNPAAANFLNAMLKAKNIDQIKFTMVYESKGALPVEGDFANGTQALDQFVSDMIFFRDTYFGHPSYLYINGRPVVYVYLTRYWKNFETSMLDAMKEAVGEDVLIIADNAYYEPNSSPHTARNGIRQDTGNPVFEAYTSYNMYTYPRVRDGERAIDYMFREALPVYERWSNETVFFPHVLPKYHDFRDGHKPLAGDTAGLLAQLETFACLPRPSWYENEFPNLMFVTSFNEWWEGTSIEPDAKDQYGYSFLDTIKSFKDSGVQCQENELYSLTFQA